LKIIKTHANQYIYYRDGEYLPFGSGQSQHLEAISLRQTAAGRAKGRGGAASRGEIAGRKPCLGQRNTTRKRPI
jgi:hypothetical protein